MKRFYLIIFFLLFSLSAQAQMLQAVVGAGGAGCNSLVDYVGTNDQSGAPAARAKDSSWCFLFTPTCYGTLKNAYLIHANTSESTAKVCVYSDNGDSIANSSDLKLGCSSSMTTSIVEWSSQTMDGGTLTSGKVWVCLFVASGAANTWSAEKDSKTVTYYYNTSTGHYDTPPANLTSVSNSASGANHTMYVTVGE